MSKGLYLALCYMSFLPLWISILFIDIKSVVFDKNERYITEYISIIVIVLNLIICLIYAFFMLKSINRSEDAMHYTIKSVKENKESIPNYLVTYILPLFTLSSPPITLRSVVLPHPEGPRRATSPFSPNSREVSFMTWISLLL